MDASINPALAEARFCPRCGQLADITFPRSIACPHCGYAAYFNPKPVAGAIPVDDEDRVILLRRGFDPAQGRWTFPGGFVDLGESVEDAAHRETNEELGIPIELGPLVGVYSRAEDRVVLIVFLARALGRPQTTPEATEVRSFAEAEIPWDELAFWSTHQALRDALGPWEALRRRGSTPRTPRRAHEGSGITPSESGSTTARLARRTPGSSRGDV